MKLEKAPGAWLEVEVEAAGQAAQNGPGRKIGARQLGRGVQGDFQVGKAGAVYVFMGQQLPDDGRALAIHSQAVAAGRGDLGEINIP